MPLVGFGTWRVTGAIGYDALRTALGTGYRHIDTATLYGNEDLVGRAVRDSGLAREQVFLTTKLLPRDAGRERRSLAESLAALGVDYLDLWLIHWPPDPDPGTDIWRAFLAARDEGLVRSVGVSNYDIRQLDELAAATGEMPAVNQVRWGPVLYDKGLLAAHRARGVVLEGYSPLKSTDFAAPVLTSVARAHGVSESQVVLRWHLEHGIPVIPKSVTPERIVRNFDLFDFALTADEVHEIDSLGATGRARRGP
ncbi:MAG TPA: aldo/keto reductase [Micromonosporaceae bacterium]